MDLLDRPQPGREEGAAGASTPGSADGPASAPTKASPPPSAHAALVRLVPPAAGAVVATVSLVLLTALLITDAQQIGGLALVRSPTRVATATAMLLVGLSLVLHGLRRALAPARRAAVLAGRACAAGAVVAGGLALVWDLQHGAASVYPAALALAGVTTLATGERRGPAGQPHRQFPVLHALTGLTVLTAVVFTVFGITFADDVHPTRDPAVAVVTTGLVLAWAGLAFLRPDTGLAELLSRDTPGAVTVRRLMVPVLVVPLLVGPLLLQGQQAGQLGLRVGAALLVLSFTVAFGGLLLATARTLDRLHAGHRDAERRLLASKDAYRAVTDTVREAIVTADEDGRIVYVNPSAERLFGYQGDDVLGQPVTLLVPERSRADHARGFARVVGSRERMDSHTFEVVALRRDGSEVAVELSLSTWASGDRFLVTATIQDLAERGKAPQVTTSSEERFRMLFEESAAGVSILGLDGRLEQVNRRFADITGISAARLLSLTILDLTHPEDRGRLRQALSELAEGTATMKHLEQRCVRPDGDEVWVTLSLSRVRDAPGKPKQLVLQMTDIEERKRAELELQYLANHDPMTGVFNRRRFYQDLSRELSRARRYGTRGAVLLLDLDDLKLLNDTRGHAAGDALLVETSRVVRERLRATDVFARLGGDEFAALLVGVDREQAESVAADLLHVVSRQVRADLPNGRSHASVSIGIVSFDESVTGNGDLLLAEADAAMYEAKAAGGATVRVHRPAQERTIDIRTEDPRTSG